MMRFYIVYRLREDGGLGLSLYLTSCLQEAIRAANGHGPYCIFSCDGHGRNHQVVLWEK